MRICVTGGRDFADREMLYRALDALHPDELAHGAAKGADTLAEEWAVERGVEGPTFPADWTLHQGCRCRPGTRFCAFAGHRRNRQMLTRFKPDLLVAFPGGKGTIGCCRIALELGIPVRVARPGALVRVYEPRDIWW